MTIVLLSIKYLVAVYRKVSKAKNVSEISQPCLTILAAGTALCLSHTHH